MVTLQAWWFLSVCPLCVNSFYISWLSNFPIDKPNGVRSGTKQAQKRMNYSVPKNVMKGGHWIIGSIGGCIILWDKPVFFLFTTQILKKIMRQFDHCSSLNLLHPICLTAQTAHHTPTSMLCNSTLCTSELEDPNVTGLKAWSFGITNSDNCNVTVWNPSLKWYSKSKCKWLWVNLQCNI
jgi:hypothetical protein